MIFFLILVLCLLAIYLLVDKKLTAIDMYTTIFSSLYTALAFDALFKGKYNLYY
ncbi:hypothetical protein [Bacillus salacetis]|uniref:hypothetical protein n=1 Tax=Bacillus salacetis TaxID=2315464 RepID=UPI001443D83D|nr:hypothetical protein [Bacillus salacetis]